MAVSLDRCLSLIYWLYHCADVLVCVVNSTTQSDKWVVNLKSWVVNYTWQTDIILELRNFEIQIRCHFQVTLGCHIVKMMYINHEPIFTIDL